MNLQLSSSPLVSVVIPVYNGEMHISVCMDSILCQSFSSFEAIFVDDGSVDNSFRILSERASFDRRMKVIRQENMGVTCARRNGLNMPEGNIFVLLIVMIDYCLIHWIFYITKLC